MATYWCDPFLEATTQGAGTTDTSTKDGSYAAPFSITDFQSSSTSSTHTVGGVTFADGDELRLKGLAFTTLFESKGNVYEAHSGLSSSYSQNDSDGELTAVTGNSSADFGDYNTTRSQIYAFKNSDISTYLPGWSHPLFFAGQVDYSDANSSTVIPHGIFHFTYPVVRIQMGHNSASDTGIEVFRLKDTYANPTGTHNVDKYYFNLQANVKVSAGWTSETAQDGYSVIEHLAGFFDDGIMGGGDSNTDTYWDLGRLIFHVRYSSGTGYGYVTLKCDLSPNTDGGTNQITGPMILANGGNQSIDLSYSPVAGQTVTFPLISGSQTGTDKQISIGAYGTTSGGPVYKFDNFLSGNSLRPIAYATGYLNVKMGNFYSSANEGEDGVFRPFYASRQATNFGPTTFLDNSIICLRKPNASNNISLQFSSASTTTYGSNLIIPGASPLTNSSLIAANIGPHFGPVVELSGGSALFQEEMTVNASNTIFTQSLFTNSSSNPITYFSVGKFLLNSNDYRTTAHNLKYRLTTAAVSTEKPQFFIISGEHNDYDGKPLSLIGDPYVTVPIVTPASLMYNDTVSSTNVLVAQWCGQSGTSTQQAWIPLDLPVPSYTAGSDNLRAKVLVAYADGSSNSAAGSILLRAWHRDTTQSTNFRVYSSSATTVTAGGNPASPTTVTLNLSNVPSSGQDDITTVCLGIRLDFTDNTNLQKYYVVSAEVETY